MVFKLLKFTARCSLLLGAFIGNTVRNLLQNFYIMLERHAAHGPNFNAMPLVILACLLAVTVVTADCNSHAVIKSDLKRCETISETDKQCQIYTTTEVTLETLGSETCLWFTDEKDNHLFNLILKLDSIKCSFQKERLYYTFPVRTRQVSQISCIFNRFCGRGQHCVKRIMGTDAITFETEPTESHDFPGYSACAPGGLGVGCTVLTRAACNFYKIWFEPELLECYEVSKIHGHNCMYQISVLHKENNTVTRLLVTDSAITKNGIKISILGAFDQPQLHLHDMLVQRVGRPTEAYFSTASPKNFPKAGMVGAVQADISYTKSFIFDPELSKCDFFEDRLRCITAPDMLSQLRNTKEQALPLQRGVHLFKINEQQLESDLLISSAVKIQLQFSNFKISVQTSTICPKFEEEEISVEGCYDCPILARLSFKALSTCQPGIVMIMLQEISIHTKAIRLTTEPTTHIVKFAAQKKCFTEKLCLKSPTLIQCKQTKFCLNEPSVELIQLDMNYTNKISAQSTTNIMDFFQFPNMNFSVHILKFIGSFLFIICVCITIISSLITCCCRRR